MRTTLDYYNQGLIESTLFELYKSNTYSEIQKALLLAEQLIVNRISKVNDKWNNKNLRELKKEITEEVEKAYSDSLTLIKSESELVANIVAVSYINKKLPIETINEIINNNNIMGYSIGELFKITKNNHVNQLKVSLASGVAQNLTTQQIIKNYQLKNDSLTKSQLKTAVFTTLGEAREIARYKSYSTLQKDGLIQGYESVGVLDSRTSEICRDLDGKQYIDMNIDDIPNKPKRHFNCRSILIPIVTDIRATTRASQFGKVPNETYGTWFSKQSEDFQRLVLKPKKYELYKQGRYTIGGIADVKGSTVSLNQIENALKF